MGGLNSGLESKRFCLVGTTGRRRKLYKHAFMFFFFSECFEYAII